MRIAFGFTCRECGEDVQVRWDTSHAENRPSWERAGESA